ncbi:MAG: hypothetical protein AB7P08_10345 [Burkholderiales bacterium]
MKNKIIAVIFDDGTRLDLGKPVAAKHITARLEEIATANKLSQWFPQVSQDKLLTIIEQLARGKRHESSISHAKRGAKPKTKATATLNLSEVCAFLDTFETKNGKRGAKRAAAKHFGVSVSTLQRFLAVT